MFASLQLDSAADRVSKLPPLCASTTQVCWHGARVEIALLIGVKVGVGEVVVCGPLFNVWVSCAAAFDTPRPKLAQMRSESIAVLMVVCTVL